MTKVISKKTAAAATTSLKSVSNVASFSVITDKFIRGNSENRLRFYNVASDYEVVLFLRHCSVYLAKVSQQVLSSNCVHTSQQQNIRTFLYGRLK